MANRNNMKRRKFNTAELEILLNQLKCFKITIKTIDPNITEEQLENFVTLLIPHIEQILEGKKLDGLNHIH